jgi:3-oxoadipate enol-lactonase
MPSIKRDFGGMYYRLNGRGDETVVLLHEYFGTGDSWNAQRAFLARYFTVVTPDLRGHGRSPVPDGRITVSNISEDIVALLDHLGAETAHLVGCSLGAVVALDMARRIDSRVNSVVAASVPVISDPEVLDYGRHYVDAVFPGLEASLDRIHGEERPRYSRTVLIRNFEQDLEEAPPDHVYATEKAGEISRPVLIVTGDLDPVLSPLRAVRLATDIPDASLGLVPASGHLVHQKMPAVFNEFVLDHLMRAGARH